jgi:hypothetical protein
MDQGLLAPTRGGRWLALLIAPADRLGEASAARHPKRWVGPVETSAERPHGSIDSFALPVRADLIR